MTNNPPVISVRDVVVGFGGTTVLDHEFGHLRMGPHDVLDLGRV